MTQDVHPPRKILLVVTTGGFTHAAPVLEIGRVLSARGHTIEFATLQGQENWAEEYEFITRVHLLGPGPTKEQLESHYRRMQAWDISKGLGRTMDSKYLFDSFWPQTYHRLKDIMNDPATRPNMMVADYFAEAVNDIHVEYNLPIAVVCPKMPSFMLPCSYIPGEPGFQLPGTTTSEHASIWLRIRNELFFLRDLRALFKLMKWTKKMRRENGVNRPIHRPQKPDYLVLVNSFFGLEIPRDLPPTCAVVGPLLSPTYPPLDADCEGFLENHKAVMYLALGTHVILPNDDVIKIINGVLRLMQDGSIDGVIWAIGKGGREDINNTHTFKIKNSQVTLGSLLSNSHPNWLFPFFAPQRAILEHESTKLYFTHGGGSSANEALFHGKPIISMGFFGDQIANTTRLVAGGVAESLDKFHFTSDELHNKARQILHGENGAYQRNILRMKRIAHVAANRKNHAVDLIEELIYDNELRFDEDGKELQPMHLQTADMRMSAFRAGNWDLVALGVLGLGAFVGSMVVTGRLGWMYRGLVVEKVGFIVARSWGLCRGF